MVIGTSTIGPPFHGGMGWKRERKFGCSAKRTCFCFGCEASPCCTLRRTIFSSPRRAPMGALLHASGSAQGAKVMMSSVIGGAMLPHAPQFFTMPETEDKKVVEHVREVAAEIGKKLHALEPDLWIIFSNAHAE